MELDEKIKKWSMIIIIQFLLIVAFFIRNITIDYDDKCPLPSPDRGRIEIEREVEE